MDEVLDCAMGMSRTVLRDMGAVPPFLVFRPTLDPNGNAVTDNPVVLLPIDTELMSSRDSKMFLVYFIKELCDKFQVQACAFCTEAWKKTCSVEEFRSDASLEEDHDSEGVIVVFQVIGKKAELWHSLIVRDSEGKPSMGEFEREQDATENEGLFADLMGYSNLN